LKKRRVTLKSKVWHLERANAELRRQVRFHAANESSLRGIVERLQDDTAEMMRWTSRPEALERIRLIVEDICAHYGLDGAVRGELLAAVHRSISARPLSLFTTRSHEVRH
jgi:hypothetical protein